MSKVFRYLVSLQNPRTGVIARRTPRLSAYLVLLFLAPTIVEADLSLSPQSAVLHSTGISIPATAQFTTSIIFPDELSGLSLCLPDCTSPGAQIIASPGSGGGSAYGADWSVQHSCDYDASQMNGDCTISVSYTPLNTGNSQAELKLEGFSDFNPSTFTASLTGQVAQSFSVISLGGNTYSGTEGGSVTIPVSRRGAAADLLEAVSLSFDVFPEGGAVLNRDYAFPNGATLAWNSGEAGTKNLLINLTEDSVSPEQESFNVAINTASLGHERIGQFASADVSIIDNPPLLDTVTLSTDTLAVEEDDGRVDIVVRRTGDEGSAASVNYAITRGTASLSTDISPPSLTGQVSWSANDQSTNKTIRIPLVVDDVVEANETFIVTLSGADGVSLGTPKAVTVTIINDDEPTALDTVALTTDTLAVEEDVGRVDIIVRRTGDEGSAASVNYAITRGTASLTDDISPPSLTGQVSWSANDQSANKTIRIPLVVDDVVEADETFFVTLSGADGVSLGTPVAVTVTIINDDEPTALDTVALTTATLKVEEDDGRVDIIVRRTGDEGSAASVNYAITRGTASLSADISPPSLTGQVSWSANDQSANKTIRIPLVVDDVVEANETFIVTLSGAAGVSLGTPNAVTVTIINDDEPAALDTVALTTDTLAVEEDDGRVDIIVRRTGDEGGAASVNYAITRGTASLSADISPPSLTGLVSWSANDQSTNKTIRIPLVVDDVVEADETFIVTLSGADGVSLGTPVAVTVTIINDDVQAVPGTIQFTQSDLSVNENAGSLTVNITRTGGRDGAVSVDVNTRAGSAAEGEDFEPVSTRLSWASGDVSSRILSIPIKFDTDVEVAETFTIVLSNATPGNEVIGSPAQLTVTISNIVNGQFGLLQFADSSVAVDEDSGTISLSVLRRGGTDGEVSVVYTTEAGTASAAEDFVSSTGVLRWDDGDSNPKNLSIPIVHDTDSEPNEQFSVILSDAKPLGGQQLGSPSRTTVTIRNVDHPVVVPVQLDAGTLQFANTSFVVTEDDANVVLSVQRIGESEGAVSIQYETVSGSALAGADFTQASGTLNWADSDSDSKSFSIDILGDVDLETEEAFEVVLLNPVSSANAALEVGAAVADITINDSTNVGQVGFSLATVRATELQGQVIFDIERLGGDDGPVTVDYVVSGETATAGEDFTASSGVVTWADGESGSRSITVLIHSDDLIEETETFVIRLSNATPLGNEQIQQAQMQVQIGDSSAPEQPAEDALPYRLSIVSGNGQSGLPGDTLDPLVIEASATLNSDTQVEGVSVIWRVMPAGSAELLSGERTETDTDGLTSNQIRILSRGFVRVIAVPGSVTSAASAARPAMTPRINPPTVELAQGEVAFTIRSGFFAASGLSANHAETGRALDTACEALSDQFDNNQPLTTAQLDLRTTCLSLDARLQDGSLAGALERLAPEELFFFADSIIDTADLQITNVYSRINAIRSGRHSGGRHSGGRHSGGRRSGDNGNALDLSGLNLILYGQQIPGSVLEVAQNTMSGGGASSDSQLASRLGVFANGTVSVGTVDGDDNQRNADVQSSGLTIGVDYRLNDNAVFGAGLGIASKRGDFTPDEGTAKLSAFSVTLFGTWYKADKGYFDAVLDVGRNRYDVKRRINFIGAPDQFAIGNTDASVLSFTVGVGSNLHAGAWEFGPYSRLSLTVADVDAYSESANSETAGFGSVLNISSHAVKSTTIALGGQLSRTINTRRGVFLPQVRIESEFEYEDRKEGIEAAFQNDPTQSAFTVNGNPRDTRYINVGLGTSAVFRNGKSGYLFYETRILHDYVSQHWLKLGLRIEF
ncbi:MAG: Calx-beta domain-containing protein [Granulosicoccus sp.]